jgi:hypothetical protein
MPDFVAKVTFNPAKKELLLKSKEQCKRLIKWKGFKMSL